MASSATAADTSAPKPARFQPSWAITKRLVFFTEAMIVGRFDFANPTGSMSPSKELMRGHDRRNSGLAKT